jgi:hypothetical protein
MARRILLILVLAPVTTGQDAAPAQAQQNAATPAQVQFFETRIRPLLVSNCFKCHGAVKKPRGQLRLDSRAGILKGGESGPAIVPGKPGDSLLVRAVNYMDLEMPPGKRLPRKEAALLEEWVRMGAPWPGDTAVPIAKHESESRPVTDQDRQWWSFRPVMRPEIPTGAFGQTCNPVDGFVLARLKARGLTFSPDASKRELIRRAYFDLIGLPPSPEAVAAFLADPAPDAYERLLDRLLATPQYGERWGRHWLDIVRFAQTSGYERDDEKPEAWRYRDYVIRSFNEDKPYDQFIREQLAGDELAQATDDSLTATAFYRLGVWDDEPDDARQAEFDELDDMVSVTATTFLGLTLGCARCHEHKFDPIPQEDYYSMVAFMRNVRRFDKPDSKGAAQSIFARLQGGGRTLAVREYGPAPKPTRVLVRGSAATPGREVQPRFVQVLCPSTPAALASIPQAPPSAKTTGRRKVLADWIASPHNPLTARVIVNRLWHYHFGRGIVATPSDFGKTGLAPTHPELVDWLASELVNGGWRLKRLHKLIMTSRAYRQSSRINQERGVALDPGNSLLWRQNLRRLDAEVIRDNILTVSGRLNLAMGGRGIFPTLSKEVLSSQSKPGYGWGKSTPVEQGRRSVYIFVKRTLSVPFLEAFDAPSPDTPTAARQTTTIAPQALILLNSPFIKEQAQACADRLMDEVGVNRRAQVERLFHLALARPPDAEEMRIALAYLDLALAQLLAGQGQSGRVPLDLLCEVVLNLTEMVYVD